MNCYFTTELIDFDKVILVEVSLKSMGTICRLVSHACHPLTASKRMAPHKNRTAARGAKFLLPLQFLSMVDTITVALIPFV